MIYEWRCQACGELIEVICAMDDRDIEPHSSCCDDPHMQRVITQNAALIIGPDFYDGIDTPYGHGVGEHKRDG